MAKSAYIDGENYDTVPSLVRFENIDVWNAYKQREQQISGKEEIWVRPCAPGMHTRRGVYGRDQFRKIKVITMADVTAEKMDNFFHDDRYCICSIDIKWDSPFL